MLKDVFDTALLLQYNRNAVVQMSKFSGNKISLRRFSKENMKYGDIKKVVLKDKLQVIEMVSIILAFVASSRHIIVTHNFNKLRYSRIMYEKGGRKKSSMNM